jgi:hypothetical protein
MQASSCDTVPTPDLQQNNTATNPTQNEPYIIEIRVYPMVVSHQLKMDTCKDLRLSQQWVFRSQSSGM